MEFINIEGLEVFSGVPKEEMEYKLVEQLHNMAELPTRYKRIALMADGGVGYGMPIGGVLASKGAISPYAVGSDIGCGVRLAKTNLPTEQLTQDKLKKILVDIQKVVPIYNNFDNGFGYKVWSLPEGVVDDGNPYVPKFSDSWFDQTEIQLGTLGDGNHFSNICDYNGKIAIMIHTGSRKFGALICKHFHQLAKELNEKWFYDVGLPFLPVNSKYGQSYIKFMRSALEFAKINRQHILFNVSTVLAEHLEDFDIIEDIDCHHNFADLENHYGENVWVHRKGAVRARASDKVVIPGSMNSPSYVGVGKQNEPSFHSCSHGAGRSRSRTESKKLISEREVHRDLESKNIILHKVSDRRVADEDRRAYKDIKVVIGRQGNLVNITGMLNPLGVYIA